MAVNITIPDHLKALATKAAVHVGGWADLNGVTTMHGKAEQAAASPHADLIKQLRALKTPEEKLLAVKQFAADTTMASPEQAAQFVPNYIHAATALLNDADIRRVMDPALVERIGKEPKAAGIIAADMKGLVIADPTAAAAGKTWLAQNQPGKSWNAQTAGDYFRQLPPNSQPVIQVTISNDDMSKLPPEVRGQLNLDYAVLYHPLFHPATTELPNTHNAQFFNATYDRLREGEVMTLANGSYQGVQMQDFQGGTMRFGIDEDKNGKSVEYTTRIQGLDVRGQHAAMEIGGLTTIDGMKVDANTHILNLQAEPNATIMNADLSEATISMASHLQGTRWQNVTFNGTVLHGVDLSGATLTNVAFNNVTKETLQGLNLAGASLTNVSINGEKLTPELAARYQINIEGTRSLAQAGAKIETPQVLTSYETISALNQAGQAISAGKFDIAQRFQEKAAAITVAEVSPHDDFSKALPVALPNLKAPAKAENVDMGAYTRAPARGGK